MGRVDEACDAAHEQGDLTDIIHREAECKVCGGSLIEEVYVGHGVVIEYECSKCAALTPPPATGSDEEVGT